MCSIRFGRTVCLLPLLLFPITVAGQGRASPDQVAAARDAVEIVKAFVLEHSDLGDTRGVVLETRRSPHLQPDAEHLPSFRDDEINEFATRFGWRVGTFEEWKDCEPGSGFCLLRDNVILVNVSRPSIRGDHAVVAVSWYNNRAGITRFNARLLKLKRDGDEWRLAEVLECVHTVGGGPCNMTLSG